MAIYQLKMNTKIRVGIQAILDGETDPYIDVGNTRYSIDISNRELGVIHWTPYNLLTMLPIDNKTYSYPFASHNIFREAVNGPSSTLYWQPITQMEFPDYPVPDDDNGSVTP